MLDFNAITRTAPSDVSRETILRQLYRRLRKVQKETLTHHGRRAWCFRCRRSIEDGDPYRIEVFYLGDDPVETRTHQLTCSQYRTRPLLEASQARVKLIPRGHIQELIMTDEQETPQEEQDETPRKRKKSKKGKKSKSSKKTKGSKKEKSTKSKGSKKSSKKSKKESGEGRSAAASAAEALTSVKAFNTKKVSKTLKAMKAGETPSNDDLTKLKEHVKAESARLREEGDGSSASELSSANRLVRRLERATR